MAKTREKKKIISEQFTKEDAEKFFAEYAAADAKIQKIDATIDLRSTKIREEYQDEKAKLNKQKDDAFEKLQHFATINPDLFAKKKSIEFSHGILGFRTGTPSLKTIKGYTWPAVTKLLEQFLPSYVRTETVPAKDRLLADREDESVKPMLTKVGVYVAQDETFYVEPKKEGVAI